MAGWRVKCGKTIDDINETRDDTDGKAPQRSWPLDADILIHFAQVDGHRLYKNRSIGSRFILALVRETQI